MSSARKQDTRSINKNQMHFHTFPMNNCKEN